ALLLPRRRELVRAQLPLRQLAAATSYRAPQRPAHDGGEHESDVPDRRLAVRDVGSQSGCYRPPAQRLRYAVREEEPARRAAAAHPAAPARAGGSRPAQTEGRGRWRCRLTSRRDPPPPR